MSYLKHLHKWGLLLTILFSFHAMAAPSGKANASASGTQTAILAGGCFWGMEEVFRQVPGVVSTEVGYTGGSIANPRYEQVSSGRTGHAEAIKIEFNPKDVSYSDILKTFFRMHDPTSLNRQGNDVGTQYRSEIFYMNDVQKNEAEKIISLVNQAKKWPAPVVTKLEPAKTFYAAEEYHQKYLVKNPHGYNDHYLRDFKF